MKRVSLLPRVVVSIGIAAAIGMLILLVPATRAWLLESQVQRWATLRILDKGVRLGFVSTRHTRVAWRTPTSDNPWPIYITKGPIVTPDLTPSKIAYVFRGSTCRAITRLGQLRGYVRIDSPADAAEFVRIPYQPEFQWQFSDAESEPEVVGASNYMRMGNPYLVLQLCGLPSMNPVPDRTLRGLGIKPLEVSPIRGGWRIMRTVIDPVRESWTDPVRLDVVQETVGRDGSYQRRVARSVLLPACLKPYVQPVGFE